MGEQTVNDEVINAEQPLMTRRKFLGLTALILARCATGVPPKIEPQFSIDQFPASESAAKARERIIHAGLADFVNLFDEFNKLHPLVRETIGVLPQPLIKIFVKAGIGEIDQNDTDVKTLRDGWGDKVEQKISDALSKVEKIKITGADESTDSKLRNNFTQFAKYMPLSFLAFPESVQISADGSTGINKSTLKLGFREGEERDFFARLYHESNHAIESEWERINSYMSRQDYARHLDDHLATVLKISNYFFSLPYPKARELFSIFERTYVTLSMRNVQFSTLEDKYVLNQVNALGGKFIKYGFNFDQNTVEQGLESHNMHLNLAHFLGSRFINILPEQKSSAKRRIENLDAAKQTVAGFFSGISHALVNGIISFWGYSHLAVDKNEVPATFFSNTHIGFDIRRRNIYSALPKNTSPYQFAQALYREI